MKQEGIGRDVFKQHFSLNFLGHVTLSFLYMINLNLPLASNTFHFYLCLAFQFTFQVIFYFLILTDS